MVVLEGRLSQEALEVDLEAEEMGEAEGSEAVGMENVGTTGGTQLSHTLQSKYMLDMKII